MSLFGNVETPRAERPEPAMKSLTELSLRVYGARLEPEQNVVRLHAEAKTAFADGTTGAGVSVGFFLNGRLLSDIASDDYGLTLFDDNLPPDRFREGDNELVVRVKGFAREASQKLKVEKLPPALPAPKSQPPAPPPEPPAPKFKFQKLAAEANDGPTINTEARRLVEVAHEYKQAVELLEQLPAGLRDPELFKKACRLREWVRNLDDELAEVRNSGTPMDVCEVAALLARFLPNDKDLARLIATLPKPPHTPTALTNSVGMSFVLVPRGRFVMNDNKKSRTEQIKLPYYLGAFPVTLAEYKRVSDRNVKSLKGENAVYDSLRGAESFCYSLSKSPSEIAAGWECRLPSKAELEYAIRATEVGLIDANQIAINLMKFGELHDSKYDSDGYGSDGRFRVVCRLIGPLHGRAKMPQ